MDVRIAAQRFLQSAAKLIGLVMLVLAITNIVRDPFGVFTSLRGEVTTEPLGHIERWRTSTAYVIRAVQPQALILGNSRAKIGYRPGHSAFGNLRTYNASLPSGTPYESLRNYEHANQLNRISMVFWGLDFDIGTNASAVDGDFTEARLAVSRAGVPQALDFGDVAALAFQYRWLPWFSHEDDSRAPHFDPSGRWVDFASTSNAKRWHDQVSAETFIFKVINAEYVNDYVAVITEAFESAAHNGTPMRIVINPTHMEQQYLIEAAGLEHLDCRWKQQLVQKAAEVRRDRNLDLELWDFSGASRYTSVPIPDDLSEGVEGYYEFSHFTPELGDKVLSRVFATPGFDPAFGVRLVPGDGRVACGSTDPGYAAWKAKNAALLARVDRWRETRAQGASPAPKDVHP